MNESRFILAKYDNETVRIYQAYNHNIADEAISLGRFGQTFKMGRMTWIKPSLLWMMYRSGWATKENQERILAIDLLKEGFEIILKKAVLSTFEEQIYSTQEEWKKKLHHSEVRCQWDPDRDIYGNPISRRAIQLGISGSLVGRYVNEWIVNVSDITEQVTRMKSAISENKFIVDDLPGEREYPVDDHTKTLLGMR